MHSLRKSKERGGQWCSFRISYPAWSPGTAQINPWFGTQGHPGPCLDFQWGAQTCSLPRRGLPGNKVPQQKPGRALGQSLVHPSLLTEEATEEATPQGRYQGHIENWRTESDQSFLCYTVHAPTHIISVHLLELILIEWLLSVQGHKDLCTCHLFDSSTFQGRF